MQTPKLNRLLLKLREGLPAIPPEEFAGFVAQCRQEDATTVDRLLVECLYHFSSNHQRLREMADQLTAPPWFPATFLGLTQCGAMRGATVLWGNSLSVVRGAPEVDLESLRPGDEVLLSHERNLLVARSPQRRLPRCETATFTRRSGEDGLLVRSQDREQLVRAGGALELERLRIGDTLLVDFLAGIAYEKVEPEQDHALFLEELPDWLGPDRIGGQRENLERVFFALRSIVLNRELASRYELAGRQTVLLYGPPGTGKTLLVRVAASMLARASGRRCYFANIKPSQLESPYVGETQRNIRELFQVLRRRAKDAITICFFDEVEGIGRIRGGLSAHHSDKFLAALLAEIEGFEDKSDIAILAATNRKDLLDPALLQRLSELEVEIKRPNLDGAREILGIHFPETLPFSPNGSQSQATRQALIDAAASQLYAPNAENEIVRVRFQDSKERVVRASELVSGRILEQISKDARTRAMRREEGGGDGGISMRDVNEAVATAMEKMRTMVTLHSAHAYLPDLPQDVTVVSVEPLRRTRPNPQRYRLS